MTQPAASPECPPLLVAGERVRAEATITLVNPATGEAFGTAPLATATHLDAAVAGARAALPGWAGDRAARCAALSAMAGILIANRDELARLLALEIGLPLRVAADEVTAASAFLTYRATQTPPASLLKDDGRERIDVLRKPIGVVGAIMPWNAPLLIACEKIGTALAAGNTVVMKASPLAPLALARLGELIADTVPAGVLSILPGGADLGEALVAHAHVGMISFTGSVRAGQAIMAAAAPGLKRLSLELGGNDPAIVLPDADVAAIAPRLFMGAFYRSGQICAAIKRVYVHRAAADAFADALAALARAAVPGDPFDPATTMGPLSNRPQFDIVGDLVAASRAGGGRVVTGGAPFDRPGFFYAPTIIRSDDDADPLVAGEQFGPALPVLAYDSVNEAIARANATSFGLGASVWCGDVEAGAAVATRIEAGSAWVNRHGLVLPDVPFGGMKLSGLGRANGDVGYDSYCELQTVSVAKPRAK